MRKSIAITSLAKQSASANLGDFDMGEISGFADFELTGERR